MKKLNNSIYGIIAIISFLAAMVTSYLWVAFESVSLGVITLAIAVVFTVSCIRIESEIEQRELGREARV